MRVPGDRRRAHTRRIRKRQTLPRNCNPHHQNMERTHETCPTQRPDNHERGDRMTQTPIYCCCSVLPHTHRIWRLVHITIARRTPQHQPAVQENLDAPYHEEGTSTPKSEDMSAFPSTTSCLEICCQPRLLRAQQWRTVAQALGKPGGTRDNQHVLQKARTQTNHVLVTTQIHKNSTASFSATSSSDIA